MWIYILLSYFVMVLTCVTFGLLGKGDILFPVAVSTYKTAKEFDGDSYMFLSFIICLLSPITVWYLFIRFVMLMIPLLNRKSHK